MVDVLITAWDQYPRCANPRPITYYKITNLKQHQDYGRSNPIIIPFAVRKAFLLYDSKQHTIAAFPHPSGAPLYKPCDVMCGVVNAEDHAFISVRIDGTWSKRYFLSVRSIQHMADGALSIGDEKQHFQLSLKYNERYTLTIALSRQGASCVALVASSCGEIQMIVFDNGAR